MVERRLGSTNQTAVCKHLNFTQNLSTSRQKIFSVSRPLTVERKIMTLLATIYSSVGILTFACYSTKLVQLSTLVWEFSLSRVIQQKILTFTCYPTKICATICSSMGILTFTCYPTKTRATIYSSMGILTFTCYPTKTPATIYF